MDSNFIRSEISRILRELPYQEQFPILAAGERCYALTKQGDQEQLQTSISFVIASLRRLEQRYGIRPVDLNSKNLSTELLLYLALQHEALDAQSGAITTQPGYRPPACCLPQPTHPVIDPKLLRSLMQALPAEEKLLLISCALYAFQISQTGTAAQFSNAAQYMYAMLERLQREFGIRGVYLTPQTLNADVLHYVSAVKKGMEMKRATEEAKQFESRFRTVAEANDWLLAQDRIKIVQMNVQAHTGGGFGVHTVELDGICFRWQQLSAPTSWRYGLAEDQTTKLFVKGDVNAYAKDWKERNPHLTFVCAQKRTASAALIGGIGYWKFNNEHYFVLYRWDTAAVNM